MDYTTGLWVALASSVLLLAFALLVGYAGRMRGPVRWFVVFEAAFALGAGLSNVADLIGWDDAASGPVAEAPAPGVVWGLMLPSLLAVLCAVFGLVMLLRRFPSPLPPHTFRRAWPAGLMGAAFLAAAAWFATENVASVPASWSNTAGSLFVIHVAAFDLLVALMASGVLLLAIRALGADTPRAERGQMALFAAALALYPFSMGMRSGLPDAVAGEGSGAMLFVVAGVGALVAAAYWIAVTARTRQRSGRMVAWTILAFALLGILLGAFNYAFSPSGPSRILAILILGYAVLRHQMLGLDVKVRWTISKGTVAGILLAAIFVTSEGAQTLFGEDQQWLGLVAGGAVVFAIAPLQRAADRLAEKAVPSAAAIPAHPHGAAAFYARQVEIAWSDGRLRPKERRMLRSLRVDLGLPVEVADEIERVAEETAQGPSA